MSVLSEIFAGLTPDRHCVEALALTASGAPCNPRSPEAVRWCATGWVAKRHGPWVWDALAEIKLMDPIAADLGFEDAEEANDYLGYAFIQAILK